MSVTRAIAQMPRGQNRFVVTINTDIDNGNLIDGYGDFFLQSDFDEWYANNASVLTKLGKSSYLITNNNLYDVARDLPHALGQRFLYDNGYNHFTLMDMGAEITMGTAAEPRQIVFRKVKLPAISTDLGNSRVGYVVTENNQSDMTRPRLLCVVARS